MALHRPPKPSSQEPCPRPAEEGSHDPTLLDGRIDKTSERQRARPRRARYFNGTCTPESRLMGARGSTNGPALAAFLHRVNVQRTRGTTTRASQVRAFLEGGSALYVKLASQRPNSSAVVI